MNLWPLLIEGIAYLIGWLLVARRLYQWDHGIDDDPVFSTAFPYAVLSLLYPVLGPLVAIIALLNWVITTPGPKHRKEQRIASGQATDIRTPPVSEGFLTAARKKRWPRRSPWCR